MEIQQLAIRLACVAFISAILYAQGGWFGINAGVSTRGDVERAAGPPLQAITETLVEYKSTAPGDRAFVQYREGGVVERVEVVLAAAKERGIAQRELGLAANPEMSKKNARGKTEEFYGSAMVVLTLGDGRVERYALYSRELFEASGGKMGGPVTIASQPTTGGSAETGLARPPAPSVFGGYLTIPAATRLDVRLSGPLSTNKNKTGDQFHATLVNDIVVDGQVVARKGAEVEGRVTTATKSGRVKGRGELHLELVSLHTTTGQVVPVATGSFVRTAESSAASDAKKAGAAAAVGAIIGAAAGGGKGAAIGAGAGGAGVGGILMVTRGKPAELPVEALLDFHLTLPVTVPLPSPGR